MALTKPNSVADDIFMSNKWDEITASGRFSDADTPLLTLLVQWYAVLNKCMSDVTDNDGELNIVMMDDMGKIQALPQLSVAKNASAEIRALNKQLGIVNKEDQSREPAIKPDPVLEFVINDRRKKAQAGKAKREVANG
jgi:hypothetical protein